MITRPRQWTHGTIPGKVQRADPRPAETIRDQSHRRHHQRQLKRQPGMPPSQEWTQNGQPHQVQPGRGPGEDCSRSESAGPTDRRSGPPHAVFTEQESQADREQGKRKATEPGTHMITPAAA